MERTSLINQNELVDSAMFVELYAKVAKSRSVISQYIELVDKKKYLKAEKLIGGSEGRTMMMQLASMDKNGDGKISKHEMEKFQETGKELIDKTLSMILNTGVVGALILSISLQLSMMGIQPSNASTEYFTHQTIRAFTICYYTLVITDACIALTLVFSSLRLYTYLSYWICSYEAKLNFLADSPMQLIAIASMFSVQILFFAIPFGISVVESAEIGVVAVVICSFFFFLQWTFEVYYGYKANHFGINEARRMVYSKTQIVPEN